MKPCPFCRLQSEERAMSKIYTCPDCGATDHMSKIWPDCKYCGEYFDKSNNMDTAIPLDQMTSYDNKFDVPEQPFDLPNLFDHKVFPVSVEYIQRAARLWCKPMTQNYEMQPAIAHVVAKLIYHLERAETELRTANSNAGRRAEIAASITPILNKLL